MKLSIVATLYQSAQHIDEFYRRATASARELCGDEYEIVLVNDGSPDDSLELGIQIANLDPHVVIVDLSRNFGHHKAMMTGLAHARGGRIFLIDSDLEEEPEWLLTFTKKMGHDRCDVVYGVQSERKGGVFERWSGRLFYSIFRTLTQLELPINVVVARLMTRRYVNALLQHDEREVFMAGLWFITGFEQRAITVTKHSTSVTTYTIRRKADQLIDSVTSFSNAPLYGIFVVGLVMSLVSGTYAVYLVVHWIFLANPPDGWTSLMASVWLLGGLITAFIGIIGIYLSKVFSETKRRPYTIVRQIYRREAGDSTVE